MADVPVRCRKSARTADCMNCHLRAWVHSWRAILNSVERHHQQEIGKHGLKWSFTCWIMGDNIPVFSIQAKQPEQLLWSLFHTDCSTEEGLCSLSSSASEHSIKRCYKRNSQSFCTGSPMNNGMPHQTCANMFPDIMNHDPGRII